MGRFQPKPQLTKEQARHFCEVFIAKRQRARTDLFWLCNEVLAPPTSKIIVPHAHGAIIDHCQRFPGYFEAMHPEQGIVVSRPLVPMWELAGPRDNLLLVSRGHLKTTIHTVGHAVQWILNYPDVRILICTATGEQAERMVGEIKAHFQFNNRLRFIFPEFCPNAKRAADFGSKTEFTVPNRTRKELKEPTVMTASIGSVMASTHHDVMKCSDVVSEANTKTKGQIQEAKDFFGYLEPLRERGESKDGRSNVGWKDVEGTIYDFADYYSMILDHEAKLPEKQRQWHIAKQSCWVNKEKRLTLWPERFPAGELDRILNSPEVGPYIFSSQYELEPVPPGTGLATPEQIQFFPAHLIKQLMPRYRVSTTIDVATLDGTNTDGDYCAMVTAGFDGDGRLDVFSIQNGRFSDEQLADLMFLTQRTYPKNMEFRIQKDQISGGFKTFLRREMAKRQAKGDPFWYLNVSYVPIPTNESKTHKIIRNLRGWFALGLIRFADNLTCKQELINQVIRFPRAKNDDILDALADQMHDAKGEAVSDSIPREVSAWTPDQDVSLGGFNPYGAGSLAESPNDCYAEVTGL